MTNIDSASIGQLGFITELVKLIQIRSGKEIQEEDEYVQYFPQFCWVVRDFSLDLNIDGRIITSDEYLESCLKPSSETQCH